MQNFLNWLKTYNASTHFVAIATLAIALAYAGYPPFHDLVLATYNLLPSAAQTLVGTGFFVWALYKKGALTPGPSNLSKAMKLSVILLALALLPAIARGQSATSNGLAFTASTEAAACHYQSAWTVCDLTTESLDLLDWGATKENSLSIEGYELVAPSANLSAYLGGVRITPDISALLKPTNLSAGSFSVFVQGAAGVAPVVGGSKIAWFAGGGANYMITPSLTWSTIDARVGQVGSSPIVEVSTGISYLFNPQNSNNAAIKSSYLKRLSARYLRLTQTGK